MSFRDSNNIPIYPGAYFINTGTFATGGSGISMFPIYGNLYQFYLPYVSNDTDNYFVVLPGFKLVVFQDTSYNTGSSSTSSRYTIFDNTSGTGIRSYQSTNYEDFASSCKLYYKNVELSSSYDTSGTYNTYGIYSGTTGTGTYSNA